MGIEFTELLFSSTWDWPLVCRHCCSETNFSWDP